MATQPAPPMGFGAAVQTERKAGPVQILDFEQSSKIAREADEINNHLEQQLVEPWEKYIRFSKLYLQKRKDRRKDDELWRAAVRLPWAFTTIEAAVAQDWSLLTSADPLIQAMAVGDADRDKAKTTERLLEYTLYNNRFRRTLATVSRTRRVGGTAFLTTHYAKRAMVLPVTYSPQEVSEFQLRLQEAEQTLGGPAGIPLKAPDWRMDTENFERWRKMVTTAKPGIKIPAPPLSGDKEIITYEGPIIREVPFFEPRMDPLIQEIEDQPSVIRRTLRSRAWVEAHTGEGPDQFDPAMVEAAISSSDGKRLAEWEQRLAEIQGYTVDTERDPYFKDMCEILEFWRPKDKYPYCIVLNRDKVINRRPDQFPFKHGEVSLIPVRDTLIPGYAYGQGSLAQVETLLHEGDTLRSLRLDAVTLAVLGVYTKMQGVGIPDLNRRIRPGALIDLPRPDAIKRLLGDAVPEVAFREIPEVKNDIDEGTGVGANVRGAQASLNRVPAAESASRLAQAQLRFVLSIAMMEEDLARLPKHLLSHWYQFPADPKIRVKIGGGPSDGWVEIPKQELLESFNMDLQFRGGTQAINAEIVSQQLTVFLEKAGAFMAPHEQRALAARIFETMKLKGVNEILTPEVTLLQKQLWSAQTTQQIQMVSQPPGLVGPDGKPLAPSGGGGAGAPAPASPIIQPGG